MSKKKKKERDIKGKVLKLFKQNSSKTYNYKQIAAQLEIKDTQKRNAIIKALGQMTAQQILVQKAPGKYSLVSDPRDYKEGMIDINTSGNAYLINEEGEDTFIARKNTNRALDGDRVLVYTFKRKRNGKKEGEVVEVLERKRQNFVGILERRKDFGFVNTKGSRLHTDFFIEKEELKEFFPDIESLQAEIFDNDPQLMLLEISMSNIQLEVQQEENKLQTNLDLDLSYTMSGYANTPLVGAGDFIDPGLHGFQAALTWTVPLGDQATPERIKQKKIQQEQILLNIDSRKSELDVNLQTILRDLELAEQEVSTAQAVVKLAEEQLQNEIERFKLGQGTSFQVSQFQQQQSQAKAQDILARVRYEKAYLRLLTLTGQIYEEFNLNRTKS